MNNIPNGFHLALYKGTRPGLAGLYNMLGRLLDRGPYSHTELVFSNGLSASASFLDGGVRIKQINYTSSNNWDFLEIPDSTGIMEELAFKWYEDHRGAKYDILGNLRFVTNFAKDSKDKWFCSESNMAALGIPEPYRYGPSGAASMLSYLYNTAIELG